MSTIISRSPATHSVLGELPITAIETIPSLVSEARAAQKLWIETPFNRRAEILRNAREYILNNVDEIADLISKENGKPRFEAIVNDILPALDLLSSYASRGKKLLADREIPMRLMKHRKSYLQYWPKGVVAIISPWNYPFSIPFGEIVLALLAGNAVVFKPSEVTLLIGRTICEIFEHASLPKGLLQFVVGGPEQGAALVNAKLDKIFFTGSVQTGKKVMAAASNNLTPVVLELGGKDAMIVLADADLDFATSAALWGAFSNSGQACASTERILVHESIHDAFVGMLKKKVESLRAAIDLGVITYDKQKLIYEDHLAELSSSNSTVVTGGKFNDSAKTSLLPTIVTNPQGAELVLEKLKIYTEETFGPVVAVTKFRTTDEAVEKANRSRYGLLASIISSDTALAEQVARKLEVGTVVINEVMYTHGLAETPWGGVKDSGFGRVHSDLGFLEFVNVRHIHKERWWLRPFKSFWWFPYTPHQEQMFRHFMNVLYRRSIFKRLTALPMMLVEFVEMLKKEPRL